MATKPAVATKTTGGVNTPEKSKIIQAQAPSFKVEHMGKRTRYLNALIYGTYGSGKTQLAGTAATVPQMQDVLVISAESGDLTLEQFANMPIDAISCTNYKQLGRIEEFLRAHCKARDAGDIEKLRELQAKVFHCEPSDIPDSEVRHYRTVILDSLTEAEEYCMNQLLGISDSTRIDEETASAEWAEYKRNHSMVKRMIRRLRDLPTNTMFICADQFTQDETKKKKFTPQMTGKLSSQVQGFMDVVGYLVVGTSDDDKPAPRRLYVQPSPKFDAKCRFSSFKAPYFDNPTMGSILKEVGLLKEQTV